MAANSGRRAANRPPTIPEPLQVPRTPLESRQGYHPKTVSVQTSPSPPQPLPPGSSLALQPLPPSLLLAYRFILLSYYQDDRLLWKSPPSRQLSHQKRVEYESDVRERFYDDYLGNRASNDIAIVIIIV